MSLQSRVVTALALIVLSGVLVTVGMLGSAWRDAQIEAEVRRLEAETAMDEAAIDAAVAELSREVRLLAGTPPIQGLIRARRSGGVDPHDGSTEAQWRERLSVIFERLLEGNVLYLQARYIGRADEGLELVRVERAPGDEAIWRVPDDELQRKGDEPYFGATLALAEGATYVSPVDLNREHGRVASPETPVLRISSPVIDPVSGEVFGLAIINLDARALFEHVIGDRASHATYVLNEGGYYLAHPDPRRSFGFERDRPATAVADLPTVEPVLGGQRLVRRVDEERERVVVARSTRLGSEASHPLIAVVATSDLDTVTASSTRALFGIAPPVVLLGLIALALGIWLARIATRPFTALSAAVSAMDAEDRTIQVPDGITGEAKRLADVIELSLERLRANDRLEASNRELRQFTYLASHDLREPIRTITSYSALLNEELADETDEDVRRSLEFIQRSCERMALLVDGLLEHSRLGTGSSAEEADLGRLAQSAVDDLGASVADSGATVEIGDGFPTLRVLPEVRLVFQNLIGNALKFRREGVAPHVRVSAERRERAWMFTVSDNGIGVSPEHREKVFQIFQRLHGRDEYAGTGLGLAHCQKLVEMHGGRIWVEDAPGGGAAFRFTLRERAA